LEEIFNLIRRNFVSGTIKMLFQFSKKIDVSVYAPLTVIAGQHLPKY
jgi:hypothetical protein